MSGARGTADADIDMIKLLAARRAPVSACPYLATALHAMHRRRHRDAGKPATHVQLVTDRAGQPGWRRARDRSRSPP